MINEEGMFVGQILANFHVKYFPTNSKAKKGGKSASDIGEHNDLMAMFKHSVELKYNVDIRFSLFGIRHLINKAVKPKIDIKLTN